MEIEDKNYEIHFNDVYKSKEYAKTLKEAKKVINDYFYEKDLNAIIDLYKSPNVHITKKGSKVRMYKFHSKYRLIFASKPKIINNKAYLEIKTEVIRKA